MVEAMLRGWRAQQAARGLRESTEAIPTPGRDCLSPGDRRRRPRITTATIDHPAAPPQRTREPLRDKAIRGVGVDGDHRDTTVQSAGTITLCGGSPDIDRGCRRAGNCGPS